MAIDSTTTGKSTLLAQRLYLLLVTVWSASLLLQLMILFVDEAQGHPDAFRMIVSAGFKRIFSAGHWTYSETSYHLRYLLFNAMSVLLMIVFRGRLSRLLKALALWFYRPGETRARRTVLAALVLLACTFPLKFHWGFWWGGIPGWTYQTYATSFEPHEEIPEQGPLSATFADALRLTINTNALPYHTRPGTVSGPALLLHYADGSLLPGNDQLLNLVFPHLAFIDSTQAERNNQIKARMIRDSLSRYNQGGAFLLPRAVAYPSHAVYMPIPYENYPPAESFTGYSAWELNVYLDGNGGFRILKAYRKSHVESIAE